MHFLKRWIVGEWIPRWRSGCVPTTWLDAYIAISCCLHTPFCEEEGATSLIVAPTTAYGKGNPAMNASSLPNFTNARTRTRSGIALDPSLDVWRYRDGLKTMYLNFQDVRSTPKIRDALKAVLVWYAEHYSPSHLSNLFERFKHFSHAVEVNADSISATHLMNYRAALNSSTEWYLGSRAGLLRRWTAMAVPGIDPDAIVFLQSVRIKGNMKGIAVLTMDPELGRFTDLEFESLRTAMRRAYEDGEMEIGEYVLALLFMSLGPRPMQYAALKVCDIASIAQGGTSTWVLSIPRAKRRGQLIRSSFLKRTLTAELGELVQDHAATVRARFSGLIPDPDQAPMFPSVWVEGTEQPGFEFHRTGISLATWFKKHMNKLNVCSERTGNQINITATRFRRTVACRAADEGHGELIIAELLDHTDTQNVGVYVEATPGMMDRIDRAVALKLAPLAQAFAGTIITNASHATRAGDATSVLRAPAMAAPTPVGNCGQFGFCGLLAPIACYTCRSF